MLADLSPNKWVDPNAGGGGYGGYTTCALGQHRGQATGECVLMLSNKAVNELCRSIFSKKTRY
jgi:hypothetical protein